MMKTKTLKECLEAIFPSGLQYLDAAELCLGFYCFDSKAFNIETEEILDKDHIADCFAQLAQEGKVLNFHPALSVRFGAQYHDSRDKGHWIEVIASIGKLGNKVLPKTIASLIQPN